MRTDRIPEEDSGWGGGHVAGGVAGAGLRTIGVGSVSTKYCTCFNVNPSSPTSTRRPGDSARASGLLFDDPS